MATTTLIPNGDGSAGALTIVGAATMAEAIDEGTGSNDGDTTYVRGPGSGGSTSGFVLLSDTPADFDPAGITSITIDFWGRRVNAGSIQLYCQVFKSDEATALTDEASLDTTTTYARVQFGATQQGAPSKADWDGARLRLRQAYTSGSNPHGRWTAVQVEIVYNPSSGPQTISPALIDHSATLFAPSFGLEADLGLVDHQATVFTPSMGLSIAPPLIDHSVVVFAPEASTPGGGGNGGDPDTQHYVRMRRKGMRSLAKGGL